MPLMARNTRAGNLTDVPESTTLRNQVLGLPLVKFTFRYRPLGRTYCLLLVEYD
jgi:catechol 2,3-dioxygenase-like lactoylglutathione lyase family enzyme